MITRRSVVTLPNRLTGLVLLATACGAPQGNTKPAFGSDARTVGSEPARFTWKAPFTVQVSEDSTKNGNSATVSYWLDVCPQAPDLLVVSHRDFHFVTLLGKPASNPEFAATLAELAPIMSAIPRFIVNRKGAIISVEGVPELIARLRAAAPSSGLDQLAQTLEDPAAAEAIKNSAAERWQVWVQAWLTVAPHSILPQNIVAPHRVNLTQSSHAKDLADPSGSGAKLDLDLELTTDTEWPDIRPWTASSRKTAHLALNGESATREETHRYTFGWGAHPEALPVCPK